MGFILVVKALFAFAALTSQSGYAKVRRFPAAGASRGRLILAQDRFRLSPSSHGYMMAYSGLVAFATQSMLMPTLSRRFPNLYVLIRLPPRLSCQLTDSIVTSDPQCWWRPH